jgi:hypothetical protein
LVEFFKPPSLKWNIVSNIIEIKRKMENSVGIEMVLLSEATFFLTIFFNKGRPSHNAHIKNFLTIFFNKETCNYNTLVTELRGVMP